ncbi:hypothetical protein SAMN04489760_13011 [Syntrophus gentianae]|uniref:Uncharacterized protein n=1 Tax=Syntrophus gentianae TaxID=43775 RepID=A0A1H8A1W3_9BACT|nr:hypothetical protein SAMN04489760_13011 [Syntrophus gentianae]
MLSTLSALHALSLETVYDCEQQNRYNINGTKRMVTFLRILLTACDQFFHEEKKPSILSCQERRPFFFEEDFFVRYLGLHLSIRTKDCIPRSLIIYRKTILYISSW